MSLLFQRGKLGYYCYNHPFESQLPLYLCKEEVLNILGIKAKSFKLSFSNKPKPKYLKVSVMVGLLHNVKNPDLVYVNHKWVDRSVGKAIIKTVARRRGVADTYLGNNSLRYSMWVRAF